MMEKSDIIIANLTLAVARHEDQWTFLFSVGER
jgi:hypothetical protein